MPLISCKQKNGKIAVAAWGKLSAEPFFAEVGANKTHRTSFYLVLSGSKPKPGAKYSPSSPDAIESIIVTAWKDLADLAVNLEKHDQVLVFGEMAVDDYRSQKEGKTIYGITANLIVPFSLIPMVITMSMQQMGNARTTTPPNAIPATINASTGEVTISSEQTQQDQSGFEDVDIDDIFPGL